MWHNQTNIELPCLSCILFAYIAGNWPIQCWNGIPYPIPLWLFYILSLKKDNAHVVSILISNMSRFRYICYWLLSAHYISLPYYSCSYIKLIMDVICKLGVQSTFILHGRYHQHYHSCRPVVLLYQSFHALFEQCLSRAALITFCHSK